MVNKKIITKANDLYSSNKDEYNKFLLDMKKAMQNKISNLNRTQANFNGNSANYFDDNRSKTNSFSNSDNDTEGNANFDSNRVNSALHDFGDAVEDTTTKLKNNSNQLNDTNKENQIPQQQVPSSSSQELQGNANLNVSGGQGLPLGNIDIRNYITPESLNGDGKKFKKKTKNLSNIPDSIIKETSTDWEPIKYTGVDEQYPLYLYSSAYVKYDEVHNKVLYSIIEPILNEDEQYKLDQLKKAFMYVFERTEPVEKIEEGYKIIEEGAKNLSKKYKLNITEEEFKKINYYLVRDFLGLEMIEPLMHDPFIEDISCDGLNIPIFINHLKYGSLEVDRKFDDFEKLNSFIVKLAQRSNQEVSLAKPILQGALTDGSRIEAIYGKEVSQKGSSFTIRKFREEPFTPIHLIEFGTMPPFLLAYLWVVVENKMSILVSGGTATGKTTILNALSLFIPPTSKVVSIEDTPEINLPHEHWLPLVSRESSEKSTITMFDLLKASLRERPEFIIVGEIRGKEAAILFQAMATGHAGMGTVHAETFTDLVNRMTIDPINLPINLVTEVDVVIFQKQTKVKNNMVRRTGEVVEVLNYDPKEKKIETNVFVNYKPIEDTFEINEKSGIVTNLLKIRGGNEDSLWQEMEKRKRILDKMKEKKILEFKVVSDIIKFYYKSPSTIFEYIEQYDVEKNSQ